MNNLTPQQQEEKKVFMAMIKAIADFKLYKNGNLGHTFSDANFISEKLSMLSEPVRANIQHEIDEQKRIRNNQVNVVGFERALNVDTVQIPLPDLDSDDDNDISDILRNFKPRR